MWFLSHFDLEKVIDFYRFGLAIAPNYVTFRFSGKITLCSDLFYESLKKCTYDPTSHKMKLVSILPPGEKLSAFLLRT